MLREGSTLLEYEVWGHVGGGGMSDVYLARHVDLFMPVIIKTLKLSIGSDPAERLERLRTEARLTARIKSHRVVQPLDVGMTEDTTPFLVQQYVDGLDLHELDTTRRRVLGYGLPLWYVCETAADVASGLLAAHRTGVLHRDLKPSNLFVSPEEGVKLGDFGVAVAKSDTDQGRASLAGTLEYMAPETLLSGIFRRNTDVYGLGATAFHLRYGRAPFGSMAEVLTKGSRPSFPAPQTPEEAHFQQVVSQMIEPDPERRWPEMTAPLRAFSVLAGLLRRPLRAVRHGEGVMHVEGVEVTTRVGDLAAAEADGLVSPTNAALKMHVGASEALVRAGGPEIEAEAQAGGTRALGSCIVTTAGKLKAKRVLHAVSSWNEVSCVGRAFQRVLLAAEQEQLESLAIPALGTGAGRISIEASALAIAASLRLHLLLGGSRLKKVDFVLFDDAKLAAFREVLESMFLGEAEAAREAGLVDAGAAQDTAATVLRRDAPGKASGT